MHSSSWQGESVLPYEDLEESGSGPMETLAVPPGHSAPMPQLSWQWSTSAITPIFSHQITLHVMRQKTDTQIKCWYLNFEKVWFFTKIWTWTEVISFLKEQEFPHIIWFVVICLTTAIENDYYICLMLQF